MFMLFLFVGMGFWWFRNLWWVWEIGSLGVWLGVKSVEVELSFVKMDCFERLGDASEAVFVSTCKMHRIVLYNIRLVRLVWNRTMKRWAWRSSSSQFKKKFHG